MATIKKPAKKMQMGGGIKPMMKKGGSFPDLNKDGKITKADILKGRGVIAKKGMKVKKAQNGTKTTDSTAYFSKIKNSAFDKFEKNPKDKKSFNEGNKALDNQYRQTLKGKPGYDKNGYALPGEAAAKTRGRGGIMKFGGKMNMGGMMKKGGKMTKKCAYGCK